MLATVSSTPATATGYSRGSTFLTARRRDRRERKWDSPDPELQGPQHTDGHTAVSCHLTLKSLYCLLCIIIQLV